MTRIFSKNYIFHIFFHCHWPFFYLHCCRPKCVDLRRGDFMFIQRNILYSNILYKILGYLLPDSKQRSKSSCFARCSLAVRWKISVLSYLYLLNKSCCIQRGWCSFAGVGWSQWRPGRGRSVGSRGCATNRNTKWDKAQMSFHLPKKSKVPSLPQLFNISSKNGRAIQK